MDMQGASLDSLYTRATTDIPADIHEHEQELLNLVLQYFRLDSQHLPSAFVFEGGQDELFDKAVALQQIILAATTAQERAHAAAVALLEIASLDQDKGHIEHAAEVLRAAEVSARAASDMPLLAKIMQKRAANAQRLGDFETACRLWEEHADIVELLHKKELEAQSRSFAAAKNSAQQSYSLGATETSLLQIILDSLPFGVAYYSRNLLYPFVNKTLLSLLNVSKEEFIANDGSAWTHPEDFALERSLQQELLQGKRHSFSTIQRLHIPNGTIREVSLTSFAVSNDVGEVTALLSVIAPLSSVAHKFAANGLSS